MRERERKREGKGIETPNEEGSKIGERNDRWMEGREGEEEEE